LAAGFFSEIPSRETSTKLVGGPPFGGAALFLDSLLSGSTKGRQILVLLFDTNIAQRGRGGLKTSKTMHFSLVKRAHMAALSVVAMTVLSNAVHADDSVNRLLELQLKKGIITQQEYDEFLAASAKDSHAVRESGGSGEAKAQVPDKGSGNADGVALVKTETTKIQLFAVVDLSIGYTSHSLVQSGEMPTSIGPYISGGVRYPRAVGGVPYPASNMSGQTGLFNSALSTSSWGIRASRDIGSGGLKAFVVLDSAFNPATGQLTNQAHNEAVNSRYPTTSYATSSLNGSIVCKRSGRRIFRGELGKS
jgi:hypothetical protein